MNVSQLINEILTEWAYRVEDGMPNPKNPTHLKELGIVLSEMGLSHIKNELVENLLTEKGKTPEKHVKETEGTFKNPVLNKTIKYKNTKGEDSEGLVGNLLRLPKDHPGRQAAERLLPPEGSDERDALNKDLGGQNQPQGAQEPKGDKGGEEGGAPQEDPIKKAAQMFDPKADPAMAARLDKEKETLAQIAKDAEKQDKEAEKEVEPEKKDNEFNPIPAVDVQKEIPQADPDTFGGESDIPDGIDQKDLNKFNTDIQKVKGIVDDAKAKGEKAPNINLCQITVPGTNLYCDDNLGIPREEMPQFKGKALPGTRAENMPVDKDGEVDTEPVFKEMLKEKGITVSQTEVAADKLKATQSELVGAKVIGMMGALEENPEHEKITAPIYVSRDGYVIDGHHRWAAIAAYNAAHPDSQIPMKVQVIDMDIKDAIPMCNKFAEDMGIAAKKADANKETPTEPKAAEVKPNEKDPESNVKSFKGEKSGKDIKTVEFEGGGMLFGTVHRNNEMVDDILNQVKAIVPKEKWKDIVFVGEGGATGDSGELEFHDEMEYAAPKFKEIGAGVDSFDGDELDVHNDQSDLYKSQEKQTGLSQSKIKAGNWASMIGQGEGVDTMSPNDFLDDEGKEFLQQSAKEAGFPPIQNWDNPSEQDKDTLYRLSFPEDNGDRETSVNDVQVAFNKARDLNLIKKQKELSAQGKIPVVIAGEGHTDLVDDILKGKEKATEKLPEPKEPSTKEGGVIYSIGGGYYSDTPNGPAQYVATESVVEKVLIEGDESLAYLLFEAVVNKTTARGKKIKVQTIDTSKQKKATAKAKETSNKAGVSKTKATKGSLDTILGQLPNQKGKDKVDLAKKEILNKIGKIKADDKTKAKLKALIQNILDGKSISEADKAFLAQWVRIAEPTEKKPNAAKFYIALEAGNFKRREKVETGGKSGSTPMYAAFRQHMENGGIVQIPTSTFGGKKSTANQTFVDKSGKTKLLKDKKGNNIASVQKDKNGDVVSVTIGGMVIKKMDTQEAGISEEERLLRIRNNHNINDYAAKIEDKDMDFIDMDTGVIPDTPQNRVIVINEALGGIAKRYYELAKKYYISDKETLSLIKRLADFSKKDPNKNPEQWYLEMQGIFSDIANHKGEPSLSEGWANFAEVYAAIGEMQDHGKGTKNGKCALLPESTTLETVDVITISSGTNERRVVTLDGRSVKKGVGGASALTSKCNKSSYRNDKDGKIKEGVIEMSNSHTQIYDLELDASVKDTKDYHEAYRDEMVTRAKALGVSDNFINNLKNRLKKTAKCPVPRGQSEGAGYCSVEAGLQSILEKRQEAGLPVDTATMKNLRQRLESYYYYQFLAHEAYNANVDMQDFSNDSIISQPEDSGGAALARQRRIHINSSNGVSILAYPRPEFNVGFSVDGRSSNPGAGRFHNEEKRQYKKK